MADLDAYRVEPEPMALPAPVLRDNSPVVLTKEQKQSVLSLGCMGLVFFVVFYILIAIILTVLLGSNAPALQGVLPNILALASSIVAAILSAYFLGRHQDRQSELRVFLQSKAEYEKAVQERARKYKLEVERKEKEAQELTNRLLGLLKSSIETEAALSDSLAQAARAVKEAEKEYADSAFDPYWTAIEEAAGELAVYDLKAQGLSQNAQDYYKLLKGQRHNFPAFPIRIESLPNPAPVVAEFRRIVRLGQTNFQFANIWEHRKTRKVLFKGFRDLGHAVNDLGGTIARSFSTLESSISSGLALASEEQARTREALAEEAGRTRATIDARADEQQRLAEKQVRLLKDLRDD